MMVPPSVPTSSPPAPAPAAPATGPSDEENVSTTIRPTVRISSFVSSSRNIRRLHQLTMERRRWSQQKESMQQRQPIQQVRPHSFDEYQSTRSKLVAEAVVVGGTQDLMTTESHNNNVNSNKLKTTLPIVRRATMPPTSSGHTHPSLSLPYQRNSGMASTATVTPSVADVTTATPITWPLTDPSSSSGKKSLPSLGVGQSTDGINTSSSAHEILPPSSVAALRRLQAGQLVEKDAVLVQRRRRQVEQPSYSPQEGNDRQLSQPMPQVSALATSSSSSMSAGSSGTITPESANTPGTKRSNINKHDEVAVMDDDSRIRLLSSGSIEMRESVRRRWQRLVADRFQYHYYGASLASEPPKGSAAPDVIRTASIPGKVRDRDSFESLNTTKVNPQTLQELAKLGRRHRQPQQQRGKRYEDHPKHQHEASPDMSGSLSLRNNNHLNLPPLPCSLNVYSSRHQEHYSLPDDPPPAVIPSTRTRTRTTHTSTDDGNFLIQLGHLMHGDSGGDILEYDDTGRNTRVEMDRTTSQGGDNLDMEESEAASSTVSSLVSSPPDCCMAVEHPNTPTNSHGDRASRRRRHRASSSLRPSFYIRFVGRRALVIGATLLAFLCLAVLYILLCFSTLQDGEALCWWWIVKQSSTNQCRVVTLSLRRRVLAQVIQSMIDVLGDPPQPLPPPSSYWSIPSMTSRSQQREMIKMVMESYFLIMKTGGLLALSHASWVEYAIKAFRNTPRSLQWSSNTTTGATARLDGPVIEWENMFIDSAFLDDVALQCHNSGSVGSFSSLAVVGLHSLPETPSQQEENLQSVVLKELLHLNSSIHQCKANHSYASSIVVNGTSISESVSTSDWSKQGIQGHWFQLNLQQTEQNDSTFPVCNSWEIPFTFSIHQSSPIAPMWVDVDDTTRKTFLQDHFHEDNETPRLNPLQGIAASHIQNVATATEKKLLSIREAILPRDPATGENNKNDKNNVEKFFRTQKSRFQGFLQRRQLLGSRRRLLEERV